MKKKLTQKLVSAAMLAAMLLLSAQLSLAGPSAAGISSDSSITELKLKLSWNT